MTLKQKILLLPVLALVVFGAGLIIGYLNATRTEAIIDRVGRVEYQSFVRLQQADAAFKAIQDTLKGAIAAADKGALDKVAEQATGMRQLLEEMKALPGKSALAAELSAQFEAYHGSALVAARLMLQIDKGDIATAIPRMQEALKAFGDGLAKANAEAARGNESGLAQARESLAQGRWLSLLTAVVIIAALAIGSSLIIRSVQLQLGGDPAYAAQVMRRVADGDLASRITLKPGDKSSLLFSANALQQKLAGAIVDIRATATDVTAAARELAQGSGNLSQRTEAQASSLAETASSIRQVAESTRENTGNARQATSLAQEASGVAQRGGSAVGEIVQTMEDINESARSIVRITGLIDGIAFQTNILALNAAVEAARAGEQGRGFAVVASEVRALALRSAEATKEISGLINASVERVERGVKQVRDAGDLMTSVVDGTKQVTEIIARISDASSQQDSGIAQVDAAILELDSATQQNAALAEQASAATRTLENQARGLLDLIASFKVDGVAPSRRTLSLPLQEQT